MAAHKIRILEHSRAVEENVTHLKMKFKVMVEEHDLIVATFESDMQKMAVSAETSCHSKRTEELIWRSKVLHATTMRRLRESIRKYVGCMDVTLRGAQKSNDAYLKSLKLFIEGGNYNGDEVNFYKGKILEVTTMLQKNEESMMSEVEKMELIRYEQTLKAFVNFEKKYQEKMSDQIFAEETSRLLHQMTSKVNYDINAAFKNLHCIHNSFEALTLVNKVNNESDDVKFTEEKYISNTNTSNMDGRQSGLESQEKDGDGPKTNINIFEKKIEMNGRNENVADIYENTANNNNSKSSEFKEDKNKVYRNQNKTEIEKKLIYERISLYNEKCATSLPYDTGDINNNASQIDDEISGNACDFENNDEVGNGLAIQNADKLICDQGTKGLLQDLKGVDRLMEEFAKVMGFKENSRFIIPMPTKFVTEMIPVAASNLNNEKLTKASKMGAPMYEDPIVQLIRTINGQDLQSTSVVSKTNRASSKNSQTEKNFKKVKEIPKKEKEAGKKNKDESKTSEEVENIKMSFTSFDATLSDFEGDLKKVLDKYQNQINELAEVYYQKKKTKAVVACDGLVKENLQLFKSNIADDHLRPCEFLIHQQHLQLYKGYEGLFEEVSNAYERLFHFILNNFYSTNMSHFKFTLQKHQRCFKQNLLELMHTRDKIKLSLRPALGLPANLHKLSQLCRHERSNGVKSERLVSRYLEAVSSNTLDFSLRFVNELFNLVQNIFNEIESVLCFKALSDSNQQNLLPGFEVKIICSDLLESLNVNKSSLMMQEIDFDKTDEDDNEKEGLTTKANGMNPLSPKAIKNNWLVGGRVAEGSYSETKDAEKMLTPALHHKRSSHMHVTIHSLACRLHEAFSNETNKCLLDGKNCLDEYRKGEVDWSEHWKNSIKSVKALHQL